MGFKVVHYSQVAVDKVKEAGAEGLTIRWLITKDDGAKNFAMRFFEVARGGHTPRHSHDWEHEVYVLDGEGVVFCEGVEKKIEPGYVVFVPANTEHFFRNTGNDKMHFLCLIPYGK